MSTSRLIGVVVLLAVLAVFGRGLTAGFVFDDERIVVQNTLRDTLNPLPHLRASYWSRAGSVFEYYRPATSYSFAVGRAVHGSGPAGFHLTSLLLHALNAFLLYRLLASLVRVEAAAAAALLFAVHPVQAEAVMWIAGRTDVQTTTFALLTLWLHARSGQRPSPWLVPVYALALLSKESAVALPVVAFGYDLAAARKRGDGWRPAVREACKRLWRIGPVYVALIAGYLMLRLAVLGRWIGGGQETGFWSNPLVGAPVVERLLTAVHIAARYAGLVLFPRDLTVDYGFDVVPLVNSPMQMSFVFSVLVLAPVLGLIVYLARNRPAALFGAILLAAAYLPTSHLLFAGPVVMAERVLYLPMAGVAAIVAAGLAWIAQRLPGRRIAVAALVALVLVAAGVRSFVRAGDWSDDRTLFAVAVETAPRSALAWNNLGFQQLKAGDAAAALGAFERSLEIYDAYPLARLNQAAAYRELGRLEEAATALRTIVDDQRDASAARLELTRVLDLQAARAERSGESEQARRLRESAIEVAVTGARGAGRSGEWASSALMLMRAATDHERLGRVGPAGGLWDEAIAAADAVDASRSAGNLQALVLAEAAAFRRRTNAPLGAAPLFGRAADAAERAGQPDVASRLRIDAAGAYLAGGGFERALQVYDGLIALRPDDERVRHGRARANLGLGRPEAAEPDLERLLERAPAGPRAAALWIDLGRVAAMREQWQEAIDRFDRALDETPDAVEARYRRGVAKLRAGRIAEATADLEGALEAGLPPAAEAEVRTMLEQLSR